VIYKGFKFGIILQLAIGPVCLFIFQLAAMKGFFIGVTAVLGVVLVDGVFILAAIKGVGAFLESQQMKTRLKVFGGLVLIIFGFSTILGQFGINFIPSLSLQSTSQSSSGFLKAVILTVSNPLTIIFWAGVFSTKIIEENMKDKDVYYFGLGAALSTLLFLTITALAGNFTMMFLSRKLVHFLNILVGVILIYFGVRFFITHRKL